MPRSSTRCRGHLHVAGDQSWRRCRGRCRGSPSKDLRVRGEEKKREPPVKRGRTSPCVVQSGGGHLHVSLNRSSRTPSRELKQKRGGAACNLAIAIQSSKGGAQSAGVGQHTRKNHEGQRSSRERSSRRRESAAERIWISIWSSWPHFLPQVRPRDDEFDGIQFVSAHHPLPCLLFHL